MIRKRVHQGKDLPEDLFNAMKRIEKLGIVYPEAYYTTIREKYNPANVPYPYIVKHIGNPRIIRHFFYRDALKMQGNFLDYGCGIGDAIRQLIRDGYPCEKIHGFDVNDASIRLGADLYLDKEEIEKHVSVSPQFPYEAEMYDLVYSGNVIHVIKDNDEFCSYLMNAYNTLKSAGIFFGSTLGLDDSQKERGINGPPRLMRRRELADALIKADFCDIRIIPEERPEIEESGVNFCLYQFFARKREK